MGQATQFQQVSDGASMVMEIGRSMSATLNQGDAVVCIASGTQRRLFEQQMKIGGVDVVSALMREQLVCLNALDTLTKIRVDGLPDVIRFAEVVGAAVDRTAARYSRVLLFGDFSGLQRSGAAGADELDALWQALVDSRPTFVRCPHHVVRPPTTQSQHQPIQFLSHLGTIRRDSASAPTKRS